jgi:hypothetical protein
MKLAELQQALKAADPAAVLVAPRVMDRILQRVTHHNALFTDLPHRESLVVSRPVLYRHVDPDELDIEPERLLPETVLLLSRPSPNTMTTLDRDAILLLYWRRLFHASVHREFDRLLHDQRLRPGDLAERVAEIGPGEFAEIRMVLRQEQLLQPDADDQDVYVEFVAVYLELRYFAANLVPVWFPSQTNTDHIDRLIARDIDATALFHRTRLPGAPDPVVRTDTKSDESHDYYYRLMRSADRASREGNTVRAAIVRTKAARVAPAASAGSTRQAARADLSHLTQRLQNALELTDAEAAEWLKDLPPLLDKADQGVNPSEAALLFDLQKVGIDNERDIYTLDIVEWLLSGGKRPIKRPLPSQRLVRITKHLRTAAARLTQARLSDEERQHLARLMQNALHRCEERLRACFRPVLQDALSGAGLQPGNLPEQTALAKMIEEMLDRITEVGFLTFSDLRDIISRNQLKMPDLGDPQEFIRGDPLLRLDRRLATALDGVYRPGEFYLRWLERFTAPLFGTRFGRWLTLFLIVPILGAVCLLDGMQLLLDRLLLYLWPQLPVFGPVQWFFPEAPKNPSEEPRPLVAWSTMVETFSLVALLLLALIHSPGFRRRSWQGARLLWRGLRGLFYDIPAWLLGLPVVHQMLNSWPFHLFASFFFKPLAVSCLLWWWVPEARSSWFGALTTFLACNAVLNSRLGREFTDGLMQALTDFYELLKAGLLPGLIRLTIALFKRIIDALEYVLFSVDEWLRFRSGDSGLSMVIRAIGTVLWYPLAFLTRFYLVVLIEPGFNPVKAPFAILAAKPIYLFFWPLTEWTADLLRPAMGGILAQGLAFMTVWLLPDVFAFLFWETKENWGLYRSNRRPLLRAVGVGPAGETVRHLLEPGFHSGTVPRLYARLRRAEREGLQTGNWRSARTYRQSIERVEKSLRRLVEREALTLVLADPAWGIPGLAVTRVALTPRRIRLDLAHVDFPDEPARLEWQMDGAWLVAGVLQPGWLSRVGEVQREVMAAALAGLYKLAGIDIIREQVRANLPPGAEEFDIARNDLVLCLHPGGPPAVEYDLKTPRGPLLPRPPVGLPQSSWPSLDPSRILYNRLPLTWQRWVARWEVQDGKAPASLFSPPVPILPDGTGV